MFVYLIVNDVNWKIYVGKTTRSNLVQYLQQKFSEAHKHISLRSHLYAAIRKYGRGHFHIYPLFRGQTNEEICEHERLLIKVLKTRHPNIGYNICRGGEGFTGPHSEEAKKKNAAASRRMWQRPEIRENFSAKMKGHTTTLETVEKIKAARATQDESSRVEGCRKWVESHKQEASARLSHEAHVLGGKAGSRENKQKAGRLGGKSPIPRHVRWHVNRKQTNPECPLCSYLAD